MKQIHPLTALVMLVSFVLLTASCSQKKPLEELKTWQEVLEEDLHLLGHRNWILVVDKAFPEQSSAGMKYI